MKLGESKTFRILIQPFLFAVLSCLPWWLIAKFIVKTDLASSAYALAIFVIMWLAFLASNILREKLPQKERERLAWRIGENYGKTASVYFGIVLLLLLMILITSIFKN